MKKVTAVVLLAAILIMAIGCIQTGTTDTVVGPVDSTDTVVPQTPDTSAAPVADSADLAALDSAKAALKQAK